MTAGAGTEVDTLVRTHGTQVGSEGIIAILIGLLY